jgi:transcriptional regulator with XRE-family HTH domain
MSRTAVQRMREARGWTLEQLADRAGCDAGYLARVECGERTPSRYLLAHVIDVVTDHAPDR